MQLSKELKRFHCFIIKIVSRSQRINWIISRPVWRWEEDGGRFCNCIVGTKWWVICLEDSRVDPKENNWSSCFSLSQVPGQAHLPYNPEYISETGQKVDDYIHCFGTKFGRDINYEPKLRSVSCLHLLCQRLHMGGAGARI